MTRLARIVAGWLISKHALALDAALVAEERDHWEAEARRAMDALRAATAAARRLAQQAAVAQAGIDSITAAVDCARRRRARTTPTTTPAPGATGAGRRPADQAGNGA